MAGRVRCGIYAIEQVGRNRFYIGSSFNIAGRWYDHRHDLNLGKHHSPKLQRAWTKYGPDAFIFYVLEDCERDDLLVREQEYLDAFRPAFNTCIVAGSRRGVPHRPESLAKIRAFHRERVASITHCPQGHEYSPENTYLTKRNQRVCLRCAAEKSIAKYQHTTPFRADGPVCRQGHEWTPENTITLKSGTRQCRACKQQRIDTRNERNRVRYESDSEFRNRSRAYYEQHREEQLAKQSERGKALRERRRAERGERQPSLTCGNGHPWVIGETGRRFCPICRAAYRAAESPEAHAARLARRHELESAGYHDANQQAYARRKGRALVTAS